MMRTPVLIMALFFLSGCTREITNYVQENKEGSQAAKSVPNYAIHMVDASAEQCAAGGKVYEVYLDDNENQSRDVDEVAISTQVVCNGANAPTSAYAPAEVIVPCGNTGSFSEVLLRLHNGQVLVSFSNNTEGSMTRLTLLPDGTYMTTDDTGCVFSLATQSSEQGSGQVSTRSISWGGEVRSTWGLL